MIILVILCLSHFILAILSQIFFNHTNIYWKLYFSMKPIFTLLLFIPTLIWAQDSPIDFEPNGFGASWTWTPFENGSNPAVVVGANPNQSGINTSGTVVSMQTLVTGQPWAGFESMHGADIGTWTLDSTNAIIKLMVYKPVISDVGVKLVTPSAASVGEVKVANTLINQWEELTFDFTSFIGHPATVGLDQIVLFPDFTARSTDNVCYIDNIHFGNYVAPPSVDVTFAVDAPPTSSVFVFGNWNNWANYPGHPLVQNAQGFYETTISMDGNRDIEFMYVVLDGTDTTKENLDPALSCTNGNSAHTNRVLSLDSTDVSLCDRWEECGNCVPASVHDIVFDGFRILATEHGLQLQSQKNTIFEAVEIYDIVGRSLLHLDQVKAQGSVSCELSAGQIYIVRVYTKTAQKSYKVKVQ